jgi:hypothetical protein
MKVITVCASLIVLTASISSVTHAADKLGIKAQVAMRETASWDGTAYKSYPQGQPQLTVLEITIPPAYSPALAPAPGT